MNTDPLYDLVVVGGGINGAGIAADASERGLKVLLVEQNDLASGTSSASSKMIHGGLRYLEQYDFRLVRESLLERDTLQQIAPLLIRPLSFVMPHHPHMRPMWLLRLGLKIYDMLSSRATPRSHVVEFANDSIKNPLKRSLKEGLVYTDCVTNDARLVIANTLRVKACGGTIAVQTKCIKAENAKKIWHLTMQNQTSFEISRVRAHALVNATGPWNSIFMQKVLAQQHYHRMKLVKGSHLIVPRLYKQPIAYLLQNKDGRVIFVLPYLDNFTLVGTTDVPFDGQLKNITASQTEVDYLLQSVNQYFHQPIHNKDVIHAYAGVRSIIDARGRSLARLNRGYEIELVHKANLAPVINIYGGKLTTYRSLAEKTCNKLQPFFAQMTSCITQAKPLPGQGVKQANLEQFVISLQQDFPWLPATLCKRYAYTYGALCYQFLNDCYAMTTLGADLGHGLYEREVKYLVQEEWACNAEDILWRRTQLGLVFSPEQVENLKQWLNQQSIKPVITQKVFSELPTWPG